ncbi:MAG: hypothetical protein AAFY71_01190 [Bacteroidota bacterium]
MRYLSLLLFSSFFLFSCTPSPHTSTEQKNSEIDLAKEPILPVFLSSNNKAHGLDLWKEKDAISFQLQLFFGGKERVNSSIIMDTDFSHIKMEDQEGKVSVFKNDTAYMLYEGKTNGSTRFDLLTWPYFMSFPFKMGAPGTKLEANGEIVFDEKRYPSHKLSFGDEIGDAPDDWYKILQDPASKLVKGLVYIVTFSREQAEAEKSPNGIIYKKYIDVEGAQIASEWEFWKMSEGSFNQKVGYALLSNIQFISTTEKDFAITEDAVIDPKPE